ncbi:potassium transporter TrkG [Pararhodobacter oceanensis]|uniref:Potassium transporter TrkH n=1 Tax=Pararhodobacter oceanensis TaxID=2172121 RepID=A0A2T8HTL0_9RHOB|nr:potassium transporter TrkG [Pararhodobacter oceanensis]PVH28748.1 potassium transporter TrkH [Pararhodobacter oceanensis]
MQPRLPRVPLLVVLIGATGALMLVPSIKAFLDQQAYVGRVFLYSASLCMLLAAFLGIALNGQTRLGRSSGLFPLLTLIYLVIPAAMALPLAEALPQLRFVDAWFEMISSFTTTGASLIELPRRIPPALHLWRGMAGWLGGLFILAAATALLAPLQLGGFELIRREHGTAESAGWASAAPGGRLRAHAATIFPVYFGLTVALWVLLTFTGVPGFDALMQAMAVLSTSGILPRESLGGVGLAAEFLLFAFMVIALSRRFLPGRGGRPRPVLQDPELLTAGLIIGLVSLFVLARHWAGAFEVREGENLPAMGRAAWGAAFTSLSFLTTTGLVSQDWIASRVWSGLTPPGLVLMGLTLLGGGVATTAGGIKLLRVYALMRLGKAESERMIYPSMVPGANEYDRFLVTVGARSAWLFAMVFALTAIVVVALLLLSGMSLETSLIFAVSSLSNTGPLVSVAGQAPLYWTLVSDPARAILALSMVLGRLEILVFLALFLGRQ